MSINFEKLSKPYFLINPDYEGCLGYFSLDNCCYGCDDDIVELEGYEDTPFHIPGIEEWCTEWEKENYKAIRGVPSDFNCIEWHKRGLQFARILKQLVGDKIEVIYRKGTDDILLDK